LLERIEWQVDRLGELPEFFQPDNLRVIADWANACQLPGIYRADMNRLEIQKANGSKFVVQLPANYKVASKAAIRAFRDALNE
jgi:hypothetical protein